MNNQILLFVLCILIIMLGYLGFKEIRKLNIKIVDIENSIKIEKDSTNNSSQIQPVNNNIILETKTKDTIVSKKPDEIDDKFQFNESELTKELTRDFANFSYCSDSTVEQEEVIIEDKREKY